MCAELTLRMLGTGACPETAPMLLLLPLMSTHYVSAADGEDLEDARRRFPRPASLGKAKGSSSSLFSRAITSLISIEGSDGMTAEQVGWVVAESVVVRGSCSLGPFTR